MDERELILEMAELLRCADEAGLDREQLFTSAYQAANYTPEEWAYITGVGPDPNPNVPTAEEIDAARTAAGGWTRETLAGWGVPWPPPSGWRNRLIAGK